MKIQINWFNCYTKTILRNVGLLLHIPGVMALVSLPVCLVFGEYYAFWPFVLTALVSISLGQLLYCTFHQAEAAELQHAMLIVALSWGMIPLLGAIPFVAIASYLAAVPDTPQTIREFQYPLNAIFEAVSGFTSVLPSNYMVPDAIFEAASAMGTSGLSVGITNPDLHGIGKLVLIVFMWMGRVEIIPVLVLFSSLLRPLQQLVIRKKSR